MYIHCTFSIIILTYSRNSKVLYLSWVQNISRASFSSMSCKLINMTQVKFGIKITIVWRHVDVHGFSSIHILRTDASCGGSKPCLDIAGRSANKTPLHNFQNVSFMQEYWWPKPDDVTFKSFFEAVFPALSLLDVDMVTNNSLQLKNFINNISSMFSLPWRDTQSAYGQAADCFFFLIKC